MNNRPGNTLTCAMLVFVIVGIILLTAAALIVLVQAGAQVVPW